jgi:HEAT repeat protein
MKISTLPGVVTALVVVAAFPAGQTHTAEWQDVIRNLRHHEVETRLQAVDRLSRAAYTAAAEPVAALLADADNRVQAAAIEAELTFFLVEQLGGVRILGFGAPQSRAHQAFEAGPLVRSAAAAPVAVIDRLIGAMRDENARIRFDAVHALGVVAEAPLPAPQARALTAELDHYDPIMRAATARVLGRLRVGGAGDALLIALEDSSPLVRQYALEALALMQDRRALTSARSIVQQGRGGAVEGALVALARFGDRDDIELFRARLGARDAGVRRVAAEALGRAGDAGMKAQLGTLATSDRSGDVRLAAAFALQKLGESQSHLIAAQLGSRGEGAQARDYLLELGAPALPGVYAALEVATDARHRADLVHVIGYLGGAADVARLEPLTRDRDDRVRRAVANTTARLQR